MHSKLIVVGAVAAFAFASPGEEEALLTKPGSARGYIAVVNEQTRVGREELQAAIDVVRESVPLVFRFPKAPDEAKDATVVIRVVDRAGEPPMTVSPEAGRAEMNVAGLAVGLKDGAERSRLLPARARREFLRTVAYAFGAGGSQFAGNLMSATAICDLDGMKDALPVDTLQNIASSARRRGMRPEHIVDYYTACQEGWAPKPVTDAQKRDWDAVHNPPSKPLKITYDKDRQKPVVK